jgi:transcriptional regulator with XRE-family HTH domain
MLGERIRKLRKQKKLTLEALAGKELTKGMLSLIENNKANPSMESLAYIADQLEVDVSELLDPIGSQELREVLEQAEKLYNTELENLTYKYKQLIELIEPYIENLSQGYEAARLLEIYSYSLYHEKRQGWQEHSDQAAKMYDLMNITANRASIGIFRAMTKFKEHDYSTSLDIFLKERAAIETNHAHMDPMTKLDLDYNEAILYFAVGDSHSATEVMEKAIHFSNEKRIFYLIDDLYRLAAVQAMMSFNRKKTEYYLKKLKQYGEFADNLPAVLFYKLINMMTMISDKKDYTKALEKIDRLLLQSEMLSFYEPWFILEKGKVLYYLGRFEEAIICLDKVVMPDIHHPYDLSLFYVIDSFKALVHRELGNMETALNAARRAVNHFETLPDTPFKGFSQETYRKIENEI